jgi:hypothetical protein
VFSNSDLEKVEALFAQRSNSEKMEEAIVLCDKILATDENSEVAVYLAKLCYFKGGKLEDKSEKEAVYIKGFKAGEIVLNKIAAYKKAISDKDSDAAMKALSTKNMDALYWTAANTARYAKYTSFTKKLKIKGRIRYLWDRVLELDANYNYGGAYRFFGGYFALVPSITGEQDIVKSKEMFEKALKSGPEYLDTKVLFADAYCTHSQIKDITLFRKLLKEVQEADISSNVGILPENKSAKEAAKRLLAKEAELFED